MYSSLTIRQRPFPNSYWVTDTILAGEYPGALDPALAEAKVIKLLSGEELGDGILIVQLRMGRDELAVGGGKDDGLWTRR